MLGTCSYAQPVQPLSFEKEKKWTAWATALSIAGTEYSMHIPLARKFILFQRWRCHQIALAGAITLPV